MSVGERVSTQGDGGAGGEITENRTYLLRPLNFANKGNKRFVDVDPLLCRGLDERTA